MRAFPLGPVELNIVALDGPEPSPDVLRALAAQVDAGTVNLLDFVVVHKSASGEVTVRELDAANLGLAGLDQLTPGLVTEEDLRQLAEHLPPRASAAVVAFELAWARELAEQLTASGTVVLATERIPATVVNAALDDSLAED